MNDTACFILALGAHSYRLCIKPLLPFKMVLAFTALIFISRHRFTSNKFS